MDIGHNAYNRSRIFGELRPNAFPDEKLLPKRILIGPVLPGHGLIDHHYARRASIVLLDEIASTQNWNLEYRKVAGRNAHPVRAAAPGAFAGGAPHDVERQPEAYVQRQAATECRRLHSRNGIHAFAALA